jgi:hypothetical protein
VDTVRKKKRFEIKIKTFRSLFAAMHNFWVSASDAAWSPLGQYQWPDGTPVDKSTWGKAQPSQARVGKENCVFLITGDAKLYDAGSCVGTTFLLCELSAQLSSCL